ncbi:MAG TPA: two-component regulator propeller domain-containing protein [Gemmatimonadaceae bacterium]|nr:two-component regulator propeller domain-containing protein [Gemmatimonadaceae bacterium]
MPPTARRSSADRPGRQAAAALVALLLCFAPAPAAAQRSGPAFERIAQERGLSNGTVTAIAQGRVGLLWFGTEDGLNLYDGSGFTLYRPIPGDTTSLADGWVTDILIARDGTRWFATLHGGLNRYLPRSQTFHRYRSIPGDSSSISSDQVNAMYEAPDGAIWLATARGLDRFDPATGRARRFQPVRDDSTGILNDVLAITDDGAGRLWISARAGLFAFDPGRGSFERLTDEFHTELVLSLLRGSDGVLWIGTENELLAVDPRARKLLRRYESSTPAHSAPLTGRVLALYQGARGTIWVGSDGGLASLDPENGTFARYSYSRDDPLSLGGNIVRSVLVDRGGVLWVGLETYGVSKYAPSAMHFALIRHDPSARRSLSDGYVRGISQDSRGDVWIGTQFGGLDRIDHETGHITVYRHYPGDPHSLPGDNVWATLEDHNGTMWVGLHERGLGTFDPRTGSFTRFALAPRDVSVNQIYEDRAGALLVGLEGRGLLEISPDRRSVHSYGKTLGDERVLVDDDVQAILEDRQGMLWVGGVHGLTRLDRRTGAVAHFTGVPGRRDALGADFVTNIFEDSRGAIWVATKGGGLSRFDRSTGRFMTIGTADGLPHSFVYGILEDARGYLWLSTDNGIAMLDPRTLAITRYGLDDGLQAREFNRRAHFRSSDGTMYFGGVNGVNVFRPDAVAPAPPPPSATFVTMRVGNDSAHYVIRLKADSVVRLAHDQNAFTFTFVALDFTAPEKINYAHRLEGLDREWIGTGSRGEASYTNLPPGRYVLHVAATNVVGAWNRDAAAVTLVIDRPWWATWWARVLAALLVVGLLVAVVRIRLRSIRRRSALLEQRVEEQTRNLTDAQARLHEALERERETARELFEITAAVPGAVFQLRVAPGGSRSFPFVSEGIAGLYHHDGPGAPDEPGDPRRIARLLVERIDQEDRAAAERVLAAPAGMVEPWRAQLRWYPSDESEARWLSVRAHPSRHGDGSTIWTGVMTDATAERRAESERAALESKMLQAQKSESLGILAGGVAHDFNNLLVGILASADLLRYEAFINAEADQTIGHIRTSALRAADLTRQMLAYAGKGRLVVERVDLSVLVREMLTLVRSAVPRTIEFDFAADEAPSFVEADATQLRQVVMNLVTNASEAVGDRAGRVTVRVGLEERPRSALDLLHSADDMPRHGPYVTLEVADDGCGMDAALLERIFDPFFSTKFTGRGLGLAALLGIVQGHHGGVKVDTGPGRGTRFLVYLPLAETEVAAEPEEPPRGASEEPSPVTAARILVVDDEETVRLSVARILGKLGYEVITAGDGSEAVGAACSEGAVDLILMDVTMPTMDGPTAARELRGRGVATPIVLMSGYAEEELVNRGVMAHADGFLKKPFEVTELLAVVRDRLTQLV